MRDNLTFVRNHVDPATPFFFFVFVFFLSTSSATSEVPPSPLQLVTREKERALGENSQATRWGFEAAEGLGYW